MANKKIYINARYLLSRPTGVERYAYEMCRALVRQGTDITLVCPKNGEINEAYDISTFKIIRFGIGKSHFWEQLVLPLFFLFKRNYLVVSFTGLGSILVPHKLMTIHDLSFMENPSWFSRAYCRFYKMLTPLAVRTSAGIITVSEFSKSEILKYYKFVQPDNIHVIHSAPSRDKFSQIENKSTEESPYILAVSSMDPRKNFKKLAEAFMEGINDVQLKIVGGTLNSIFASDDCSNIDNVCNIQLLGRVSDAELSKLYAHAAAFIFPSLYEGFGLPPLEAMLEGCPVLASEIPSVKEICADAALYFNPEDIHSMRNTINFFLKNQKRLMPQLVDKGLKNVSRFSWGKNATALMDVMAIYNRL